MSKLKVFFAFAVTSVLTLVLDSLQNLSAYSFAVSLWTVNIAGVLAAIISSNRSARIIFFLLIGLNVLGMSHIAYVAVFNPEVPIVGLALVALLFNVNVWLAAMGASAAPSWKSATKYTNSEKLSNWAKIDKGEDPTL
jgi:hypothetical protein